MYQFFPSFRGLRTFGLLTALVGFAVTPTACTIGGDDDDSSGSGGSGGGAAKEDCGGRDVSSCDYVVAADTDDDTKSIQSALSEPKAGETICLCPGEYEITRELNVAATRDVTVKGIGDTPEDTVLDFAKQEVGDDGMTATGDGITIENFWVKNTPGNGIVVTGAEDVTFRKIKVTWDAGAVTENGAYAVYPTRSNRILVEECEVIGASDAGVYVGQSTNAIVRNNKVHQNVAGIEVENTTGAEVYGNEMFDNTAGLFIPLLQNLERKESVGTWAHDNDIHDNNRENFGETGSVISFLPEGTGVLMIGADKVQLNDNKIKNNNGVGVMIIGLDTFDQVTDNKSPDPETDKFSEEIYLFNNEFDGNGGMPFGILAGISPAPLEDVLWDGFENTEKTLDELCFGMGTPPSFRNFAGVAGIADKTLQSTDPAPHGCTLPKLEALDFADK